MYSGAGLPLLNRTVSDVKYVHGNDGLGDAFSKDDLPPYDALRKDEHAVTALQRLTNQYKGT